MKVTPITRKLSVTAATYNSGTGNWTLTTAAAHLLNVNEVITFMNNRLAQPVTATCIAGTTGSTIVFANTDGSLSIPPDIFVTNFGTGFSGAGDTFTFQFNGAYTNGLIHVVSNGTATATVKAQGSLDQIHWVDLAAATAITAGSQLEIAVTKAYSYGRLNFTVASASAGGVANTIKAYKAGC